MKQFKLVTSLKKDNTEDVSSSFQITEGIDYTGEDEPRTASDVLQRIIPGATMQTDDGVEVGSNTDVGSGVTPLASKFFHPTIFLLIFRCCVRHAILFRPGFGERFPLFESFLL